MLARIDTLEMPHSIEAEQGLLGAILLNQGALTVVEGIVTADDFYEQIHRKLFADFVERYNAGGRVTLDVTLAMLGEYGAADVGGLAFRQYVARLAAEATTVINAPDFARIIRDLADKRRLIDLAETLKSVAASDQSATTVAVDAIEALDGIVSSRPGAVASRVSIGDAAAASVERMTLAMQNPGCITGVTWGLHDLDERTGGLQRSELVVVAGRPGMGKSGLAISSARQSAGAGNNVLFFSLEMSDLSLADRIMSDHCFDRRQPIPYCDISKGRLANEQAERVVDAQRNLRTLPLTIEQQASLTVSQIAARARKRKQALERDGKTLDVVIIDHMHIVKPSERYSGNRVGELTEISGGLKALAKELNVPVVVLAQLNRQVEGRDNKRPTLSDLRDSGAIEQDADLVVFLYREAYYLDGWEHPDKGEEGKRVARLVQVRHQLEVNVAKQRNGPTGQVTLFFDVACNAVRDMARSQS
jgi:replicative DNA helicase